MKILIVRVSAIGDVVHTLPALFLLKHQLPMANISWVIQEKAAALLKSQPSIENLWILPNQFLSPQNIPITIRTLKQMRQHRWDAIIDFQGLLKTSLVAATLTGKKFGFDVKNARERLSTWFTHHQCSPEYTNIIQKNLALASAVVAHLTDTKTSPTLDTLKHTFTFTIPTPAQSTVNAWLTAQSITHPIVLCPNTTWESKHWPLERWHELIDLLGTRAPAPLVLVGQHHGASAKQLAQWIQVNKRSVHLAPAWDLMTTAALIAQARTVIAPDTGLLHLADFFGITSVGIFGPTLKERHGPFLWANNIASAIQVPCQHRYKKTHVTSTNAHNCMFDLEAAMVADKIGDLVQP